MDFVSLDILRIDTLIADVRVRQSDDLLAIAGVSEDFLVAGERGVEHHFADCGACCSDRVADKDRAVCERQDGGRESSLKRQKHWVLRNSSGTPQHSPEMGSLFGCLFEDWAWDGLWRTG